MSQPSDPLEERDILKILDALSDSRVQKKILSITKMEVLQMSLLKTQQKTETTNANKTS